MLCYLLFILESPFLRWPLWDVANIEGYRLVFKSRFLCFFSFFVNITKYLIKRIPVQENVKTWTECVVNTGKLEGGSSSLPVAPFYYWCWLCCCHGTQVSLCCKNDGLSRVGPSAQCSLFGQMQHAGVAMEQIPWEMSQALLSRKNHVHFGESPARRWKGIWEQSRQRPFL